MAADPSDSDVERVLAGVAAHAAFELTAPLRSFVAARAATILAANDPAARAADVYLAAACTTNIAAAIAHVDAMLPALIRPVLARLGMPASDDDEIVQRTRIALFAPDSLAIAKYSGRGELAAYIRAIAAKLALKRREREHDPATDDDPLAFLPDSRDSPEVAVLKQRCRDEVRAAFAVALTELDPRERTLLRQHYLDNLSIDALAPLHDVHRATCARWIEAARTKILRGMRGHLRDVLDLAPADLESAIDLVRSQLDLSLARHLAD